MKRLFVGGAALAAVAWVYACDNNPQSHVYVAALYDSVDDCFGPSLSLATIQTPNGDLDCAPTCLALDTPPSGGPTKIYVSTMCGPYPPNYDTSQTDPGCPAALAAWPAEQAALASGSNSCASPATEDAGEDAGTEDAGASEDGGAEDATAPEDGSSGDDAGEGGGPVDASEAG